MLFRSDGDLRVASSPKPFDAQAFVSHCRMAWLTNFGPLSEQDRAQNVEQLTGAALRQAPLSQEPDFATGPMGSPFSAIDLAPSRAQGRVQPAIT